MVQLKAFSFKSDAYAQGEKSINEWLEAHEDVFIINTNVVGEHYTYTKVFVWYTYTTYQRASGEPTKK